MVTELRLDLGCGPHPRPGFVGVDIRDFGQPCIADLSKEAWVFRQAKGLEAVMRPDGVWRACLPDNSVDEVFSSQFVEHLTARERINFVNELYRVLKPGGQAEIITPHWSNGRAYGDLTHCFSDDTEVLAESGWKRIVDVVVGERVHALNLTTEESHLAPVIDTRRLPYAGPMLQFSTECMDLLVTPNHDLVWRSKGNDSYWARRGLEPRRPQLRKSAASTFVGMGGHHPRRGIATLPAWRGAAPARIRIADDESINGHVLVGEFDAGDFCELVGWFVSEGHVDRSSQGHYRIAIAQSSSANPDKVHRIESLLRRMQLPATVKPDRLVFSSKPLALFFEKLGLAYEKRVPDLIKGLAKPHLHRFLESALLGDGRSNGTGWEYATTSTQLADDVQEIALKLGYRTSVRREARAGREGGAIKGRAVISQRDLWMVGISVASDIWYPTPTIVHYSGAIACLSLGEMNTLLVRRNGRPLWAGNCWPPVVEHWYFYLKRAWREKNAPHCDEYTCNFETDSGSSMTEQIATRNQEYQQFASVHYTNANLDLVATLTALK